MSEQKIGAPVDTTPAKRPTHEPMRGRYVDVVPLEPAAHGTDLYQAAMSADPATHWTYLSFGPWTERCAFDQWLASYPDRTDQVAYALIEKATGKAAGMASYMRMDPVNKTIEVGSIWYSPALQRSRAATEAMYLMARNAFEQLGYRRYEWKCNVFNDPSQRAARRLGFTFEGVFRQHMISRGRTRDTAWFSMLDGEWPQRKRAFERWLEPANFDAQGRQKTPLNAASG